MAGDAVGVGLVSGAEPPSAGFGLQARAVIWTAAGTWGLLAWGVAALGAPVQLVIAVLLAMRRPVPVIASLLLPLVVVGLGVVGALFALGEAHQELVASHDPAFAPFFALHDRASALAPGVMAGFAGALLALGPAAGAAWGALRERERSFLGPIFAGPASAVALLLGAVGAAGGASPWWTLPVVGLGLAVLGILAGLALSATSVRHVTGPAAAVGALAVGALGLAGAGLAAVECGLADVFGSFEDPWSAVATIVRHTDVTGRAQMLVLVASAVVLAGAMPGLLTVRARRLDLLAGADLAAVVCAVLALLLGALWIGARRFVITRLVGAYPAAVLSAASLFEVPRVDPLPPRVYVADDANPRFLTRREGGGFEVERLPVGTEEIGPRLGLGDGLVLPPTATADRLYLLLAGTDAGQVSLVGCRRPAPDLALRIQDDPLLAAGQCAAAPMRLRVTDTLPDPRVLIVLREHYVDDGGEVIGLPQLRDVAGRDVVMRVQLDATVADVVVVLRSLSAARRVYLGWGVGLDGDDIPIGVDPTVRIAG